MSPGEEPDPLLEKARGGDPVAIEALLKRYLPGLRAFIRLRAGRLVRAKESTTDLAQSICREILEHLERFQYRGEAGFKHWLYTTALRKLGHRRRYYAAGKRDVQREVTPAQGSKSSDPSQIEDLYKTLYTPSQEAIRNEDLERIEQAFDKLSEDQREVIVLSRLVGLSHREIAQEMNRSEVAVRSLLSRALATLADLVARSEE
jgi:RNA polymerase sigma-70 factor (ECF subfamily)